MRKITLLSAILLFVGIFYAKAQTIYVDIDATGANDGTSWANAFIDLQDAIDAATTGEIWIAEGVYKPTKDNTGNASALDVLKTFLLKDSIQLYGGFNGTEVTKNQRNWRTQLTRLDGAVNTSYTYHVVSVLGTAGNPVSDQLQLDGLIIEHGQSNVSGHYSGAGAIINYASAIFRNCTFQNNVASYHGAGLYASYGSPQFIGCTFNNNQSTFDGAAINMNFSVDAKVVNCLFHNNTSARYGGAIANVSATSEIINCTFAENTASTYGRALFFSAFSSQPITSIKNCIFRGNGGSAGGDVENLATASSVTIHNCYIPVVPGGITSAIHTGDPLLMDMANNDFSLQCNSPAIDAGDSTGLDLPATDFAGNPRYNGTLDIGAYESTHIQYTLTSDGSTLTAQAGSAYQWLDCDNNNAPIVGETSQTYMPTSNGNYAAVITVGSCTDTTDCENIVISSIENGKDIAVVSLFPNPTSSQLHIQSELLIQQVQIYSINGALLKTIQQPGKTLDVSDLPQGMYMLVLQTEGGQIQAKFVKE